MVVGGSDTSLSLIEHLIFNPHLHFNNLLLVSPHGIPKAPPHSLAQSCCFSEERLSLLGLSTWVNVVKGRLVSIDRESQSVAVQSNDGEQVAVLPYDYLVLGTGLQYQLPPFEQPTPQHVFTVNDQHEEAKLLLWVRERLSKKDEGL